VLLSINFNCLPRPFFRDACHLINPLKDQIYLEWPNRFWAMSLDLNLFLDFLKLFVNMRLVISFA
jgi:hypothetical protein